jgi:hypothetical protein
MLMSMTMGRRMVSDYVMTQANCEGERVAKDSVGLASYPIDFHFCQRVVVEENGHTAVRNEGGFGHSCKNGPYPVSLLMKTKSASHASACARCSTAAIESPLKPMRMSQGSTARLPDGL